MGGKVFSSGEDRLYTPRMPKDVYRAARTYAIACLNGLFVCVSGPLDGPGKTTWGDIDLFVLWPKVDFISDGDAAWQMKKAMSAVRFQHRSTDLKTCSYAIHWPDLGSDAEEQCGDFDPNRERFCQVDVTLCTDIHDFGWKLFLASHGDIWGILGSIIRPFGLTATDKGLYLRIPEIENKDRKRSMIFLSRDPVEVLNFLGLDATAEYWHQPFGSAEDLFEYVTRCRMFHVADLVPSPFDDDEDEVKAANSKERRRLCLRPVYRQWIEDFRPSCLNKSEFLRPRTTRERIKREAFDQFRVGQEFFMRRLAFMNEDIERFLWNKVIKESVPKPTTSNQHIRFHYHLQLQAIKSVALHNDASYSVRFVSDTEHRRWSDVERVREFVVQHRETIGREACIRHYQNMEKKAEKAKLDAALEVCRRNERPA
ncbi:hypothetical protein B0I35DRAFT_439115 [Stachybotrys elegans]|uniref:Uncharacterized protein n=1 Tax=Stachybotrys elegans TaxID=80388 RepID=A0A8K0WNF7_9HYPO|nr:hypothetical protein B0I35DRAFT_439115 [Stachybotrys elegans]